VNKELIIDGSSPEVTIALLEDKKLVELHKEFNDNDFAVGDVYFGKVKRIISGLNAAFVDIGYEKDAFLHYLDLGTQFKSYNKYVRKLSTSKGNIPDFSKFSSEEDINKNGKISQVLQSGEKILVKVAKEPISNKGPRVTCEISLPGRYVVLIPFSNKISISQKIIDNDERTRLKRLVQSIISNNFGVIIRTVAENKKVADLDTDLRDLLKKWNDMIQKIPKAQVPSKVHGELGRSFAILRDILNDSFNSIYVNNAFLHQEIKIFIENIYPDKVDIVKLHKSKANIFEFFDIDKQIKSSFGKKVILKNGSYLIVEHTEAFHVIDVNSGYQSDKDKNQESNALEVNLEAATEIARQLRLRDMGGIIVIDFIDMSDGRNRRTLYEKIKEEMKYDRAKHSILPPSKFGLVQITRQRVRPATSIDVLEQCPVCQGTGKIKSNLLIIDEIENQLSYLVREQNEKNLKLIVSPFVYTYLTKGFFNIRLKWILKYHCFIRVKSSNSFHFLKYQFINRKGEEIHL